jgi:hypothetical protein
MGERMKNVKGQLAMRAKFDGQVRIKKYVVAVGTRLMEEIKLVGNQLVMMGLAVKVIGEWHWDKMMMVLEDLEKCEVEPDYILVFGPGNEMVIHGRP